MKESVLVTGGAGFIGSHIVDTLIDAGYRVAVVDDLSTGRIENLNPEARFYRLDICNRAALDRVFADERPMYIYHEAARADVRGSLADPVGYAMVNIVGSLNLLEACRQHGVRKFIFASTGGAVYGEPPELPVTEAAPTRPLDPYGASKLAVEGYLHLYHHNYGLEYCVLRYPNVYGPRQNPNGEAGVVAIFTGRMLRGAEATINGDGSQTRDFAYVGDIARANLLALEKGSGIYNLGSGTGTNINTIYHQLAELTGYFRPALHGPAKQGEVRTIWLDSTRARQDLGWQPHVDLREGLRRTVYFFQPDAASLTRPALRSSGAG